MPERLCALLFFFFNDTATTEIYTLSLHDALPIYEGGKPAARARRRTARGGLRPEGRPVPAGQEHADDHDSGSAAHPSALRCVAARPPTPARPGADAVRYPGAAEAGRQERRLRNAEDGPWAGSGR